MSKKLLFVYNPLSGKAMIKNKLSDIVDIMVKNDYEVNIHPTQRPRDAYELVSETSQNYDLVVCSGGDGTLDEVVSGMIKSGQKVPIGYIPAGSTNDFATSLKIPKRMKSAAKIAVEGKDFACDVGRFNNDNFVYIAAFGLLTDVSYETSQELKNVLGHTAYLLEGAKRWHGFEKIRMRVEYDDVVIEDEFCYGMISNSTYIGGMKNTMAKDIGLDDGEFEVVLVKSPKNPLQLNRILSGLVNIIEEKELIYEFKAKKVRFHTDEPQAWTLDGEYGGDLFDVEVENLHHAINIKVPQSFRENEKISMSLIGPANVSEN